MILQIKKIFSKSGIDLPIFYTSFSNLIGIFGNIFTLFLIITFLTKTEQGFYFTFGSILSLQIFFELGFNAVITQFSSHEMANLVIDKNTIIGNNVNLSRLASLLRLIVKWYSTLFIFLLVFLIFSGLIFFSSNENNQLNNIDTTQVTK